MPDSGGNHTKSWTPVPGNVRCKVSGLVQAGALFLHSFGQGGLEIGIVEHVFGLELQLEADALAAGAAVRKSFAFDGHHQMVGAMLLVHDQVGARLGDAVSGKTIAKAEIHRSSAHSRGCVEDGCGTARVVHAATVSRSRRWAKLKARGPGEPRALSFSPPD